MVRLRHGDRNIRFGEFELHTRTRELQKNGNKVGVQEQPFLVLMMLLERRFKDRRLLELLTRIITAYRGEFASP